jgi:hypothetical protein
MMALTKGIHRTERRANGFRGLKFEADTARPVGGLRRRPLRACPNA